MKKTLFKLPNGSPHLMFTQMCVNVYTANCKNISLTIFHVRLMLSFVNSVLVLKEAQWVYARLISERPQIQAQSPPMVLLRILNDLL